MRRALLMAVGVVALGLFAAQAPTGDVMLHKEPACKKVCRVPVFISLQDGKIVVEPETVHLYWGTGVVFEIEAEAGELVEVDFGQDPFKEDHGHGWYGTQGPAKLKTPPSVRSKDLPDRNPKLIGHQKPPKEFKYTVRWSRGRAKKTIVADPYLIFRDNGA